MGSLGTPSFTDYAYETYSKMNLEYRTSNAQHRMKERMKKAESFFFKELADSRLSGWGLTTVNA